jgi:hypothetical protein
MHYPLLKTLKVLKFYNNLQKKRKFFFLKECFLKMFFKHGLQVKYLNFFNKGVSYFYFYFYFFSLELKQKYGNYIKLSNTLIDERFFFSFEVILT